MVKAVIFDLDGTLTDTLEDLAASVNGALVKFGHPVHDIESYKYFVGTGTANLIRKAFPEGTDEAELAAARQMFFEHYGVHYLDKTRPYEGINEMLEELLSRGIKLAVCSNKIQHMTEKVADVLFRGKFICVFGQNDRFPIKPDPAAPLYIMERLGVSPDETVFVGDSGVDMQTGKNSGCKSLGVLWGFRTRDELLENGADALAEKPQDILNIIERM